MSRNPNRAKGKIRPIDRNTLARAIFDAVESAGVSNRQLAEQLIGGVIDRLEHIQREGIPTLPGMEDLIVQERRERLPSPTAEEIQAVVNEVLAEKAKAEVMPADGEKEEKPGKIRAEEARPGEAKEEVKAKEAASREPVTPPWISPNAMAVLERRYLKRDSKGKVVESPEDMFRRVARNIASSELLYDPQADVKAREEEFYRIMADLEFLPNSPTLMNAGRELQQLSACFVLPIEDSMESIFDAVKYTALIHKSGGGTGFSFSRLRPEKDRVGSTGGVASGPVSFMRAFDTATDVIKQGGMRRGANMAILTVDHPDILKFIAAKEDNTSLQNFNLSVAVDQDFMEAVGKGADYDLINPRTQKRVGKLNAKAVFDRIVDMAWRTGDPGIIFLDRINRDNPTPKLSPVESTNPCGEQPLLPYESCNLGSINVARMLHTEKGSPAIDWEKLGELVKTAVRFLDNVIDVNKFPLSQIDEMTKKTRKIGLGVMGFADMLIQLGIPYDSEEALEMAERVMEFIDQKARDASIELAQERGEFPAFKESIYDVPGNPKIRNSTRTTIAPTGTLSIIADCSSGIEPLFALSYVRQTNLPEAEQDDGKQVALIEVNRAFEEVAKKEGLYSEELMRSLAEQGGIRERDDLPEWVKRVFATAHDISPQWHVRMQAAFQKHTDNAVSKTVNFPHHATREDVAQVFLMAYSEGCKGITIYRDRSKEAQVLSTGGPASPPLIVDEARISPRPRPRITKGGYNYSEKVTTGCGNLYVMINADEQGICDVFASLGKAGGCASAQLELGGRLMSIALRAGLDPTSVVKMAKGIRCPSIAWDQGHAVLSCPDAIGIVLEHYIQERWPEYAEAPEASGTVSLGQCPECSSPLIYQEGCYICRSCGYTKC